MNKDAACPLLLFEITHQMQHHFTQPLPLVSLMFAGLFHVLSMFLPSKLLTLPKVSENMEISIDSPKTIEKETDASTSSVPAAMGQPAEEPTAEQGALSPSASSLSDTYDTADAGTETPRSLTPGSSVANEDDPSRKYILSLSGLWTEHSERVR